MRGMGMASDSKDKNSSEDQANGGSSQPRDADFSKLDDEGLEDVTEEEVEESEMGAALEEAQAEAAANNNKYLRALADLENYKKRALKERSDLIKYQGEKIFAEILEVIDNIELALNYSDSEPQKLKEGLELIHKMFLDTLGKWEVRPETAIGKPFDPNKQEAISKIPTDEVDPGVVIQELKKTFFYRDKLLRPGEVVVSTEVADEEPEDEEVSENGETGEEREGEEA
jgi:molecular chaperone GrpE